MTSGNSSYDNTNASNPSYPHSGDIEETGKLLTGLQGRCIKTTPFQSIQSECDSIAESDSSIETVEALSTRCTGEDHFSPGGMSGSGVVHFSALELEQKSADPDDDPVDPACHDRINLSSRHLSDILALFDGAHLHWPKTSLGSFDSANDAKTTVTSNLGVAMETRNPLVVSLERECEALEEISHRDTVTILQLKDEVEALRTRSTVEVTEALRFKEELEIVKKERDLLKEREAQHMESLRILKQELDFLTRSGAQSLREGHELERLRVENELFATQIIENEVEMREIRTVLKYLDEENCSMRKKLEALGATIGSGTRMTENEDIEHHTVSESLATQVMALALQISEMKRVWDETKDSVQNEMQVMGAVIKEIKEGLHRVEGKPECNLSRNDNMLRANEGIEVTVDGIIGGPSKNMKGENKKTRRWNGLCDCFHGAHIAEE